MTHWLTSVILLAAVSAGAQTLPEQQVETKDTEVSEYLDQQIRKGLAPRQILASEVKFNDGSVQTTATAGIAAGNVFTSSLTVGSLIYSTTITATSVIINGETVVAVSSFASAASAYIYGFVSSRTYVVNYELLPLSDDVSLKMQVNDVSATFQYTYINNCFQATGGGNNSSCQACAGTSIQLTGSDNIYGFPTKADQAGVLGQINFRFNPGAAWVYANHYNIYQDFNSSDATECFGAFNSRTLMTYPANIKLFMSAGNMRGRIWVTQTTMPQIY